MSADPTPAPDADVIDALNAVYRPVLTAFEQFHRLEHRFEVRYRYMGLRDRYDCLVEQARCWRRHLLNRIERLGGEVDSTMGSVEVSSDVGQAYRLTLDTLRGIFAACIAASKVCDAHDDPDSCEVLGHVRCEVDCEAAKVEAYLRQIDDLGPQDYLATLIRPRRRRSRPTPAPYAGD